MLLGMSRGVLGPGEVVVDLACERGRALEICEQERERPRRQLSHMNPQWQREPRCYANLQRVTQALEDHLSNTTLASRRARPAPRQKCGSPAPSESWRLGSRVMSKVSGLSKAASSRFAEILHNVVRSFSQLSRCPRSASRPRNRISIGADVRLPAEDVLRRCR
jgi:hypothetical protein